MATVDRPTRDQLIALLFSDGASEAWEHDALGILHSGVVDTMGTRPAVRERAMDIMEVVASEAGATDSLDGGSVRDDLRDLSCSAKRLAILLLHVAFAAEQALQPKPLAKRPPSPQLALVSTGKQVSR